MITTKLLISEPNYYSCELTKIFPIKVNIITINGDIGFGINETLDGKEESLKKYIQEFQKSPNIIEVKITYKTPLCYWTRVIHQLTEPSIYETILENNCMSLLPIVIEKGLQSHTVLSPSKDDLKVLLDVLKQKYSIVHLKQLTTTPFNVPFDLLTPKQADALKVAYSSGYYEIPRRTNVTDLASNNGVARVTFQERLRRAENRIIREYILDNSKQSRTDLK
ncbi:MAG: helix-turn-helix domain-containing protein [Candidatus Hodarchaeales archaeon]|jgi:predicted DNA binding protein